MDHGGGDLNNGGLGLHFSACMATGQSPLVQASPGVVYAKCRPVYDDSIAEDKCTKRQSSLHVLVQLHALAVFQSTVSKN